MLGHSTTEELVKLVSLGGRMSLALTGLSESRMSTFCFYIPFYFKPSFREVCTINQLYHNHGATVPRMSICCASLLTRQESL